MMLTGLNPGEFADFVAVDVNDDLVGAQPCHRVASSATGENSSAIVILWMNFIDDGTLSSSS